MTPFNVVMLGKSYMNPTLPQGVFGEDLLGATLPAGAEPVLNSDGSAVRSTRGLPLYEDGNGNFFESDGTQVAGEKPKTVADQLLATLVSKTPDITDAALKILLKQQGVSETAASGAVARKSGFNLAGNMPLIVIGGVALLAILFMAGTRRRA